jgi:Ca-dependent carbohydrate-binding module xylan-binding
VTILTVGLGKEFATLATAIAASNNGDVIQVQAGTYTNDFATINTKITIEGVGGMVNLVATVPPPNGKAILVTNTDVTLDNIAFSGAKVADGNGAGIRYQAGNLTINDCYFNNNQDGLLAANNPAGSITINNSEFAYNGTGDGYTHNLYVGEVGTLTINGSYFHDADVGHEIKSRALNTIIENSRIFDGPTGTASYSIDLPDGGNVLIKNNIIEQGPDSQNPTIIHVGGPVYPGTNIQIIDNTILNDLHTSSAVAVLNQTTTPVTFSNNDVFGLTSSQIAKGPAIVSGTTVLTTEPPLYTTHSWQVGTVPPDQLVAYLSESAGTGNAQFIISVDGKQLGATQTVTASHPAGQAETFSFSGSYGPGSHTIAIDFSRDTGTGGQNLYVGGIDYDGQHYATDTATLPKGGVATAAVGGSDTLAQLHMTAASGHA